MEIVRLNITLDVSCGNVSLLESRDSVTSFFRPYFLSLVFFLVSFSLRRECEKESGTGRNLGNYWLYRFN